jgi:hypothetical protein
MGMYAVIENQEVKFSGLFAQVAMERMEMLSAKWCNQGSFAIPHCEVHNILCIVNARAQKYIDIWKASLLWSWYEDIRRESGYQTSIQPLIFC